MIDLENVKKSYATGVQALNGITLHIDKGEFVFIVGDSGSGKSTLIKLLLKEDVYKRQIIYTLRLTVIFCHGCRIQGPADGVQENLGGVLVF